MEKRICNNLPPALSRRKNVYTIAHLKFSHSSQYQGALAPFALTYANARLFSDKEVLIKP